MPPCRRATSRSTCTRATATCDGKMSTAASFAFERWQWIDPGRARNDAARGRALSIRRRAGVRGCAGRRRAGLRTAGQGVWPEERAAPRRLTEICTLRAGGRGPLRSKSEVDPCMKAVTWHGRLDVRVETVPDPAIV